MTSGECELFLLQAFCKDGRGGVCPEKDDGGISRSEKTH